MLPQIFDFDSTCNLMLIVIVFSIASLELTFALKLSCDLHSAGDDDYD